MGATIRDVAKKANTSISTVSRVINRSPNISKETTKRVLKVVKELNYVPNTRGQNLARKRNSVVAFVTKVTRDTAFINPHLFEIMNGVQKALSEHNIAMRYVGWEKPSPNALKELVEGHGVDGVILHASMVRPTMAQYMVDSGFPHVIIGMPNFPSNVCWVDNNNILSGELACGHLLSIGKKKIAFIGGEKHDLISEIRLSGVEKTLKKSLLTIQDAWIAKVSSQPESASAVIYSWKNHLPEGIICANNSLALGCIRALKELNVKIPQDVAVITFDDYPYAVITQPPTSSITIDVYDLGLQAAKLLLEKIAQPNVHFQSYITIPLLRQRASTLL